MSSRRSLPAYPHRAPNPINPERARLRSTARRVAHIGELAVIALDGNEPERGIRYLQDALELLAEEFGPLSQLGKRATAAAAWIVPLLALAA